MLSANNSTPGAGPVVLYQFDCLHPTDFTFRFTPELRWMWPERNEGAPSPEWISPDPHDTTAAGGWYLIHTDYPNLAGAVTIPGAQGGAELRRSLRRPGRSGRPRAGTLEKPATVPAGWRRWRTRAPDAPSA